MNSNEILKNLAILWEHASDFRILRNNDSESAIELLALIVLRMSSEKQSIFGLKHSELSSYSMLLTADDEQIAELTNQAFSILEAENKPLLDGVSDLLDYRGLYLNENESIDILLPIVDKFVSVLTDEDDFIAHINRYFDQIVRYFSSLCEANLMSSTLSNLIVELASPHGGDEVYDPFCSFGRLLDAFSTSKDCTIFGQEESKIGYAFTKIVLLKPSTLNSAIVNSNALQTPAFTDSKGRLKQFDIVVSCPQISLQTEVTKIDPYSRFSFGIPAKGKLDALYLQHCVRSMKAKGGRAVVAVPQGVLYREGIEENIRKSFIDENILDAVITLPTKIFAGKSTVPPMVLLIFKAERSSTDIVFIDGEQYPLSTKGDNALDQPLITSIMNAYNNRVDVPDFSSLVPISEISRQQYNLSINRYVSSHIEYSYSIKDHQKSHDLIKKLDELQTEIEKSIVSLGY